MEDIGPAVVKVEQVEQSLLAAVNVDLRKFTMNIDANIVRNQSIVFYHRIVSYPFSQTMQQPVHRCTNFGSFILGKQVNRAKLVQTVSALLLLGDRKEAGAELALITTCNLWEYKSINHPF